MLIYVAATAILSWMILLISSSPQPTQVAQPIQVAPPTEVKQRPARLAETVVRSLLKETRTSGGPRSPQRPFEVSGTRRAVVLVSSIERTAADDRPPRIGSGFLISPVGVVLTKYHVIKDSASVSVELGNRASYIVSTEKIALVDPERDIAILKIPGRNLPTLRLGDSDKIRVGQPVAALGSPLARLREPEAFLVAASPDNSVSLGVVSGIRRLKEGNFIQTTATISEAGSGGPLLDRNGNVIGITARLTSEGQPVNVAIPMTSRGLRRARPMCPMLSGLSNSTSRVFFTLPDRTTRRPRRSSY